ncbi:DUF6338 family protein [Priestia megaterium]|uniref:DUF6338 family protein n=1 Tax=Priestia megaterium TaxID=1404 RepID=UPI003D9841D5
MTISNFNVLFLTLSFVIPGFIIDSIYRKCVPKKDEQGQSALLRFLWYSCFNHGIWLCLIYYLYRIKFYEKHLISLGIIWIFITFVSPIILGFLLSYLQNRDIIRNIIQRLGINPIHTVPTSWDYVFSNLSGESWVTIYLEDGTILHGSFSHRSFASSIPTEKDIFLEKLYLVDEETGDWSEVTHSKGVWIKGDNIKLIEFVKGGEVTNE